MNASVSQKVWGKSPHRWRQWERMFGRSCRWFARGYYIYPPSMTLLHAGRGLPGPGGRRRGRMSQQTGMLSPGDRRYGDYQMRMK